MTHKRLTLAAITVAALLGLFAVAPSQAAAGFCWAYNGTVGFTTGNVTCETDIGNNFALAIGENAEADAGSSGGGSNNVAIVIGNDSAGKARDGDNNFVLIIGSGSIAQAGAGGSNNSAVVIGNDSVAVAGMVSDGNTAVAIGSSNVAAAGFRGTTGPTSNNRALALGFRSTAEARLHSNNTAIALGLFCTAKANDFDNQTVTCP